MIESRDVVYIRLSSPSPSMSIERLKHTYPISPHIDIGTYVTAHSACSIYTSEFFFSVDGLVELEDRASSEKSPNIYIDICHSPFCLIHRNSSSQ